MKILNRAIPLIGIAFIYSFTVAFFRDNTFSKVLMSGIIGGFSIALIASLFAGLDVLRKRKRKLLLLGLFLTIGLVLTFMLNPSEALLIMIILGLVLLPSLLMKKRDDERPDKEIFLKSFQLGVIIIISLNIVGLIL